MTEEDKTAITMWSESLIEGLYIGIAKSGNDNALRSLLKDLKKKGYEEKYLINKVNTNVGTAEGMRLQALMGRGGTSSTAGGGVKSTASRAKKEKSVFRIVWEMIFPK